MEAGFTAESDVYKAASLLFMQTNAPSTIAVHACTETAVTGLPKVLNEGWRQLVVLEDDVVEAVSDYIEASGKHAMYFAHCTKAEYATLATAIEGNERTVVVVYDSTDVEYPEAALVGATAGMNAGSFTYKNIILKGVTPQTLTASELKAMHEAGVISIVKKAGDIVTSEGITLSGEYVDIVDSKDYIIEQIEFQTQKLMNRLPKVPYDDTGIASLENVTYSVLKDAANNGMVAYDVENEEYMYKVNFGKRAECAPADISARHYAEGKFEFTLAGAIHTAKITGSILA
ncbi:MAG: DUF3383 family protein [Paludibacteraceae bacterium]|nr:DUF3383 family protein [Paludibacteraceae bacterium]